MNKLGIITDCIHTWNKQGKAATENHILLKQFEALSEYFEEVHICCPFVAEKREMVTTQYSKNHIQFIPVKNVGGNTIKDKIKLIFNILNWITAFKKLHKKSTIIYQRFPNNLNIPGFFYFHFSNKPVFATFTGTWPVYAGEPFTYRLQKFLLKNFFRGPVWVYIAEEGANKRILKGFSPSYSKQLWDSLDGAVQLKTKYLQSINSQQFCLQIITVGSLVANKNQQFILDACLQLLRNQIKFKLFIVGDGILKNDYQQFIKNNNLSDHIQLLGKKTAEALSELYSQCHVLIQAPIHEGFGKVPIEGFFHGVVPILSEVTLSNQMINNGKRGYIFQQKNLQQLVNIVSNIYHSPQQLVSKMLEGREYAKTQTLEAWAKAYYQTVQAFYKNL